VESDAITFKPQGQKIFSYTRPLPHSSSTKGKGKSNIQDLDPQSEDVIEFEVYHVRCLATPPIVRYLLLNIIVLF
jgi:histone acetyltransferase 1